jgi:HlyD family secretion protein
MKIFLDTAEVPEIRKYAAWGVVDGVTTNPSLVAKSGRVFEEVVEEICGIVDGPISAEVTAVQADLSRTYLRAPFAGVVANISGELGEMTIPSPPGIPTPPAVDLIDDSCLYVTAPIDEVDAPAIRLAMPARISVDAFPDRRFKGHVRRVAPYVVDVEKQARTVDVEVEFSDPKETQALLVGYSADVEIVLDTRADALRVPTAAIQEGNRVLVFVPATGVVEQRTITTGLANWQHTEVTSGLQPGERVVLSLERAGVKAGVKATPEEQSQPGS